MRFSRVTKNSKLKKERFLQLSTAYQSLQNKFGLRSSGKAALLIKPVEQSNFKDAEREIEAVLTSRGLPTSDVVKDEYAYFWLRFQSGDFLGLFATVDKASQAIVDAEMGNELQSAIFEFSNDERKLFLIYSFKEDRFYPFSPLEENERDNNFELRLKALLADELYFEKDLKKWYPIWKPLV